MWQGGLFVVGHVRVGELRGAGDPLAHEHAYWLRLVDHLKVRPRGGRRPRRGPG